MRFATDKIGHGYFSTYLRLAAEIGVTGRVCEVGVLEGDSLEMWQALFPVGTVVGVDVNPKARWPEGTHQIIMSQDDPELPELVAAIDPMYDLIVDDASHDGPSSATTFTLLWPLVRPGRWYVVEDWSVGFPSCPHMDDSMVIFARGLLDHLDWPPDDVESITYQRDLLVVTKARDASSRHLP